MSDMKTIKISNRYFKVWVNKYRTVGGTLRIILVFSKWGNNDYSSVRFPIIPFSKPFRF